MQVASQKRAGTHAQNIDMPRGQQLVHDGLKSGAVHLLNGQPDLVHIRLQDRGHHIGAEELIRRLDALDGGQLGAHDLLQGLLHGRIPLIAQYSGKPDHCGLADPHQLPQLAGGHKRRLVIVRQDVARDLLLSLGEAGHILLDHM